jgi:transcriptional regulator with XRE-family HTH domain
VNNHRKYLPNNLLYLRKRRGLAQAEMQAHTGIKKATSATWSNWELGNTNPDFDSLISISKFFRVTLDDILLKDLEEEGNLTNQSENSQKGNRKGNRNGNPIAEKGLVLAEDEANYGGEEWSNKQLTKAIKEMNGKLAAILKKLDL